ncbi:hypothetical protein NFI96_021835 [Prochilodus magdalenae]|nr:hypothetical protein NFI96_021835 [Prochilodus magdalenae]
MVRSDPRLLLMLTNNKHMKPTKPRNRYLRGYTKSSVIMALDGCGQLCKFVLIILNVLFVLAGLAMLCGGLYLRFSAEGPYNLDLKTNHFIVAVSVLMVVGAVLLLIAVVGDYGSCSENKPALGVYIILLTILATLTIIAGVLAYTNIKEFSNHVGEFYATIYGQYLIKKDWIRSIILKLFHNAKLSASLCLFAYFQFDCCGLGGTLQTIMQETDTCPQSFSVLGISISTSTNCLTMILTNLSSSSVLGVFLGIAGAMCDVRVECVSVCGCGVSVWGCVCVLCVGLCVSVWGCGVCKWGVCIVSVWYE